MLFHLSFYQVISGTILYQSRGHYCPFDIFYLRFGLLHLQ